VSEITNIEWCDSTFNPWWGCTKVSPACDNCYAAALDKRTGGNHWGAGVERRRTSPANWARSLRDQCAAAGVTFLFKQWGNWLPEFVNGVSVNLDDLKSGQCVAVGDGKTNHIRYTNVGKKAAGRLLDGVEYNGVPA
jgi:protein gp37